MSDSDGDATAKYRASSSGVITRSRCLSPGRSLIFGILSSAPLDRNPQYPSKHPKRSDLIQGSNPTTALKTWRAFYGVGLREIKEYSPVAGAKSLPCFVDSRTSFLCHMNLYQ